MTEPREVYCSPNCCPPRAPCRHGANRPLGRLVTELEELVGHETTKKILNLPSLGDVISVLEGRGS